MESAPSPLAATARIILSNVLATHATPFDDLPPTAFFFDDDGGTTSLMSDTNPYSSLLRLGEEPFPLSASGIGLIHCGWVAPTSELAPSESPDRKRIVCVFLINRTFERECVMEVEGVDGHLKDAGAGEGPLADALEDALTRSYWNRLLEFG